MEQKKSRGIFSLLVRVAAEPKMYVGVREKGERKETERVPKNIILGRKRLMPAQYHRELRGLEGKARDLLNRYSYPSGWGHLMPRSLRSIAKGRMKNEKREISLCTLHSSFCIPPKGASGLP